MNKLNGFKYVLSLSGSDNEAGFSADALLSAYDEVMEHWMTRDSCSFDCYHTPLYVADYQQAGIKVERNDYSFADEAVEPLTYYSWVKQSDVDASAKVPLVVVFHGSANSGEFQVWSAGWAEEMLNDTLAVISFDNYPAYSNAQLMEVIRDYVSANPWADSSRIYLTGFSMGGSKTWSLGFEYPEFFAGLIPTAGFGSVDVPVSVEMPVFTTGGASSYIRFYEFPSSDDQYATFAQLLKLNGISDSYTFDAEADPLWGLYPTLTGNKTLDVYTPTMTLTLNAYQSKDGRWLLGTLSGDVTGHEPLREMTHIAWTYIKQFSRNADGTINGGSEAPVMAGVELKAPVVKASANTYTVARGDTLWSIASRLLSSGANWEKIYKANADIISDPNRIYVGQVLTISAEN